MKKNKSKKTLPATVKKIAKGDLEKIVGGGKTRVVIKEGNEDGS